MKPADMRVLGITEARHCEKRFEIVVHGALYAISIFHDMMPAEPPEDPGPPDNKQAMVERSRQRVGVMPYTTHVSVLIGEVWHELAHGMRSKTAEGTVDEALRKVVAHAELLRANAPKEPTQ